MAAIENKWIEFLQDTRNEIASDFIFPIQAVLKDETLANDIKINKIIEIDSNFRSLQSKWNVVDYGLIINDGSQ